MIRIYGAMPWRNIVVVGSYGANMVVVVFHVLQGKSFFMENLTLASGRRTHVSASSLSPSITNELSHHMYAEYC